MTFGFWPRDAERILFADSFRPAGEPWLRLGAWSGDGTLAGLAECELSESGAWLRGDADASLAVSREFRRRGIGGELARRIEEFAERHNVRRLRTRTVDSELEVADPFLRKRGFQETEREQTSVLMLPGNGLDRLDGLREDLRRQGIETAAFSEIDGEASRRSLYQTACAVEHDMPTIEEWDDPSIDTFLRNWFAAPGARREAIFVALEGGTVVGISSILLRADGDAEVGITGVLESHRRRGIARVLKLMVSRYAVEHRIPRIHTDNNAVNAGMLALNRALGFQPGAVIITFERRLRKT